MICDKHNRFFPTRHCPLCIEEVNKAIYEQRETEYAIKQAEKELKKPIVLWQRGSI